MTTHLSHVKLFLADRHDIANMVCVLYDSQNKQDYGSKQHILEIQCTFCDIGNEFLNNIYVNFRLKG